MFKSIDQNQRLLDLIKWLSNVVARQRGLPVVMGVLLVIIGFIFQVIEVFAPSTLINLLGVIFHNIGILTALIGLLMAEPLGK
jgi:membrane-bound ClpP family serine protease